MEEICVKILDGLYIGTYKTSMSKTTLNSNSITHILCIGHEMESILKDVKKILIQDYKFMKIEVEDIEDENILFNFNSIYDFIEEGLLNGRVLVHCYGGISRSPTIVIAYLIRKNKLSFEDAFNFVKNLKPDINPNEGFMMKLKLFDKTENKVIDNVYKCR